MEEHMDTGFDPVNYMVIEILGLLGIETPTQNQIDVLQNAFFEVPIYQHYFEEN